MMKNSILTIILFFIFCSVLFSCNHDDTQSAMDQLKVEKDSFNISAAADSTLYIKTNQYWCNVLTATVISKGDTTVVKNTTYINNRIKMYHDTLSGDFFRVITTDIDPTVFRVYIKENKTQNDRKIIFKIQGFLTTNSFVKTLQSGK